MKRSGPRPKEIEGILPSCIGNKETAMVQVRNIVQQIERLPKPLQQEVIDFVEFLHGKHHILPPQASPDTLLELKGGLENSTIFAGDNVGIQEQLRDEWQ